MTHVVEAADLLRQVTSTGQSTGTVTVAVLFGLHVFQHELALADLARIVDPSALCRAAPSPRWQLHSGVMSHSPEKDESSEGEESDESDEEPEEPEEPVSKKKKRTAKAKPKKKKKPKKRVRKPTYETAGRYVNSMEAFAEYEATTALGKAADAKDRDAVIATHRAEIIKEQAVYRDSLRAAYATYHLGDAMSMVLGQCLQRLTERQSIDQVWAALYRNTEWLTELESAARKAGNETLSKTACKLRTGQV